MFYPRIHQLIKRFDSQGIDGFLCTNDINIRYLTNFPASESWLLIIPQKLFYITDFRYLEEAKNSLKGINIKKYTNSIYQSVFENCRTMKVNRLGFDERHLTIFQYKFLKQACPSFLRLKGINQLVETLREVKDQKEINLIKKALMLNLQCFDYVKKIIKPNISEREVLEQLEQYVKSHKARFSFPPIIASGSNSSYPHAKVTNRKIRNNEPVLVDMGIEIDGYKSDLTRMFLLGKIPLLLKRIQELVASAQRNAINTIRAGVRASVVDSAARNLLVNHHLGKYFGHSLGHGVGLEIHECPRLSQTSTSLLKPNMIVTVEPAVYLPKQFGVRIEDMILVTQNGCEVLSDNYN